MSIFLFYNDTHLSYCCYFHLSTCSCAACYSLPDPYNFTTLIALYAIYLHIYKIWNILDTQTLGFFPLFPKPNSTVPQFYNLLISHLTSWSFKHNFFCFTAPLDIFCISIQNLPFWLLYHFKFWSKVLRNPKRRSSCIIPDQHSGKKKKKSMSIFLVYVH